jgi:anaerobic selenocysteine-containing dehydrogenase
MDYYAANKLMKGFIGAANIDTNSRLCMSSAVTGYKIAVFHILIATGHHVGAKGPLVAGHRRRHA